MQRQILLQLSNKAVFFALLFFSMAFALDYPSFNGLVKFPIQISQNFRLSNCRPYKQESRLILPRNSKVGYHWTHWN